MTTDLIEGIRPLDGFYWIIGYPVIGHPLPAGSGVVPLSWRLAKIDADVWAAQLLAGFVV